MNIQENIRRILKEVRVPRNERVELYKDDNIIVVVPLTHRALQKYAHKCQWCINDDLSEWEDYHQKKHAVIIQRNPKKPKIGITGNPTASEILIMGRWDEGGYKFEDVCDILNYQFKDDQEMGDYYITTSNDINNFATNIVYYSPENGIYDQEDNFLWNFNYEITDIPNVTPEVIQIMNDYLQENEEMSLQENIKKILREERNHSKLIVKLLNRLVVSRYEDVCKIKVVHPSVGSDYDFYRVFVYFNQNGKNGTKSWEENILNEVWRYVYDTFGVAIAINSVRVSSCGDNSNMNIQENIRRILREELLNEKKLFHRRIKLDDVKALLKDYAHQVYHETNNYDQFKYELTLKSVESIMWMDYGIGWEDLPEQEEIEFVTKVSDMIEDNIKRFYDYYKIRK